MGKNFGSDLLDDWSMRVNFGKARRIDTVNDPASFLRVEHNHIEMLVPEGEGENLPLVVEVGRSF